MNKVVFKHLSSYIVIIRTTIMNSPIEEIALEAYSLGLRDELFAEVKKIRLSSPRKALQTVYEEAFIRIKQQINEKLD